MTEREFAISREGLTLSSRLVTAIRHAILDGRLAPGCHLKERELCDMFQVSRSLVREAVQKLAAEELVTLVPHRGLTVTRISADPFGPHIARAWGYTKSLTKPSLGRDTEQQRACHEPTCRSVVPA